MSTPQFFFLSPGKKDNKIALDKIKECLRGAQHSIYISAYCITHRKLIDLISSLKRKKPELNIKIVTDQFSVNTQTSTLKTYGEIYKKLVSNGIQLKYLTGIGK